MWSFLAGRSLRAVLLLLAALVSLIVVGALDALPASGDDAASVEQQVSRGLPSLVARVEALEASLTNRDEKLAELQTQVADLEADADEKDAAITALEGQVATLEEEVADNATKLAMAEHRLEEFDALLENVTRTVDDAGRDTLLFTAMNLQVVNGTGTTAGTPNALGNVIIGYDTPSLVQESDKSGSHYLVLGEQHNYTRFGGIVAGLGNTASGEWASVTGGVASTASGEFATVTAGQANTAAGLASSVGGGAGNEALSAFASVSGGSLNVAEGQSSAVSGGTRNTASGLESSVSGGQDNTANGFSSSISGGRTNDTLGGGSSIAGGEDNLAVGFWSSILGGRGQVVNTQFGIYPE
jgi:hypothetical protein